MHHLAPLLRDVARLTVWLALLAAIFVSLERLFTLHAAKVRRPGIGIDVLMYFVSSLLPGALLAMPLAWLAVTVRMTVPAAWLDWSSSLSTPARLGLAMVIGEFGAYWGHRWTHEVGWLWRFHAVHHSAEHMDWLANSRAHPFDMVFVRLCAIAPLYVLGLAPAANGTQIAVAVNVLTTLWGFFIHSNVRLRFGWVEQLISTPFFHHWHHNRFGRINSNFATNLPCLDRLFGTLHLPAEWPESYGNQ